MSRDLTNQQLHDQVKAWIVQHEAFPVTPLEALSEMWVRLERYQDALIDVSGYGISPNNGYPVVSADVVKVAKKALDG